MRIIINKEILEISKYISGYHLKCLVSKKFNLNPNNIRLYFNTKEIINNKTIEYLKEESQIELFEERLSGGENNRSFIFKFFIAIILIIIYSFLMFSGFMNIISYIYSSGLVFLGSFLKKGLEILLGKDNLFLKFLIIISTIFIFIIRGIALFLTVFALTAYLTINVFNLRTDDICKAYRNNYKLSLWITYIYIIIYIIFNLFGFIFDFLTSISENTFLIGPLIKLISNMVKKGWNSIKFFPVYILPFVGNGIKVYHQSIDLSMLYFTSAKTQLNELNKFLDNKQDFKLFEDKINNDKQISDFINTNQLNTAIEYLKYHFMTDNEKIKYIKTVDFSQKDIITSRFIYWFLKNLVTLLNVFFWIFKLSCGTTDTTNLEKIKDNLIEKIKKANGENKKKDIESSIKYLENRIKNIQDNDGLDGDCVSNILKTSNAAGGFSFFFYIIILIILLIFMPF